MDSIKRRHLNMLRTVTLDFVRNMMQQIDWSNRLIAIRGQRGVGKTTLILQRILMQFGNANASDVLYVSLDNIYFTKNSLTDTIDTFHREGGKYLFLDEVHKYADWSREVKNAYDEYPDLHIVITGSSLINILDAEVDLSRRCISYNMQGLSFREYLEMFHNHKFSSTSLDDILLHGNDICSEVNKTIRPLQYFGTYLQMGYYPFLKENEAAYYTKIENIVNLIIDVELPQLRGLDIGNIRKVKALLNILATGLPMSVDITKLSKTSEISRTTLLQYLQYLHDAKILRLLYSDNYTVKRMQKPDKIYLENPNMLYALSMDDVNVGTLHEVFFANQMAQGNVVEYSKTSADFTVNGQYIFEIGGSSKDGKQVSTAPKGYIAADNEEYVLGNKIPLWLFGFMY